jgi:hypothetical protein
MTQKKELKVCDDGILLQFLTYWTLSIGLSLLLFRTTFWRLDCLQEKKPTHFGPIDRSKLYLRTPEPTAGRK